MLDNASKQTMNGIESAVLPKGWILSIYFEFIAFSSDIPTNDTISRIFSPTLAIDNAAILTSNQFDKCASTYTVGGCARMN